jgi:hypothetical protein
MISIYTHGLTAVSVIFTVYYTKNGSIKFISNVLTHDFTCEGKSSGDIRKDMIKLHATESCALLCIQMALSRKIMQ